MFEKEKTLIISWKSMFEEVYKVKISDIKEGDSEINIEAEVTEKSYAREVRSKYGRVLMVADATLKDETGKITLTLWNEQVRQVMVGNKIKIENGYAKSYRNVLQLSTGKNGKLTVIQTVSARYYGDSLNSFLYCLPARAK